MYVANILINDNSEYSNHHLRSFCYQKAKGYCLRVDDWVLDHYLFMLLNFKRVRADFGRLTNKLINSVSLGR